MSLWLRSRMHDDEGISLVEIMVGVVITGIALGAFAGTVTQALATITRDEQHVMGTQLAQEVLEDFRGLQWDQVGFYANDPGYAATAPSDGAATVTLGATRPIAIPADVCGDVGQPPVVLPVQRICRDGILYDISLEIVWRDDPERPTPPAVDPDPDDYIEIRAILDWSVQDRDFTTTQVMVRQPTIEEIGRENDDPAAGGVACAPGEITSFDVSPSFVHISPAGTTQEAVTVTVETCTRASLVRLVPVPLAERSMTEVPGSNGTRWTVDDFPAGTTDFTAGTYTWTVSASGTDGTDAETTEVQFAEQASTTLEIVELLRSPSGAICTASNGTTHFNVTLRARITGAVSTDPVTFSWTSDAGSATGVYGGTDATGVSTFNGVIPAGSRFREATTTLTVSVRRISDGVIASEAFVVPVTRSNNPANCPA